jgi:hypothetical protein
MEHKRTETSAFENKQHSNTEGLYQQLCWNGFLTRIDITAHHNIRYVSLVLRPSLKIKHRSAASDEV